MEAAIRTPEILDLVFQHLRFTEDLSILEERTNKSEFLHRWCRRRTTLLHAALTCKTFFPPAMANLWWTVDGIMPFVKLLPNIHSRSSQSSYHYLAIREWYLDHELEEDGLERFDFYAKMVTHIIDLGRMGEDNVSTVLIQLAEVRPSRRCFPKLQTVRTNSYNPDPLLFFTSPSLKKLKLRGFWTEERFKTMCGILGRLPGRSPELRVLDVPYVPNPRAMDAILRLEDLRYLSVRNTVVESLDVHEFLKSAAGLFRLEKLDVNLPLSFDGGSLVPPTDPPLPWFPALISISVGGSPGSIIPFIRYIRSTYLEEVEFKLVWGEMQDLSSPEVGHEVLALSQAVQSHLSNSLKSISMAYDPSDRVYVVAAGAMSQRPIPLTAGSIEPLFSIPILETVLLDYTLSIPNLTDAFLPSISQSWPRLVKLSLPSSGNSRAAPFTFAGVQKLVVALPYLSELSVDFVASGHATPGLEAPQLKVLNVRSSPIWNKRNTAVNLANAFPNLETLTFSTEQPVKSWATLWKEVVAWLPVITGRYSAANYYDEDEDAVVFGQMPPPVGSGSPTGGGMMMMPPAGPYIPHYPTSESDSEDPLGYDSDGY